MLLRVYRLTDKFGVVLLKLGAAFADWLLDGAGAFIALIAKFLGLLLALFMAVFGILWTVLKGFGRLLMPVAGRFGGAAGKAVQTSARAGGTAVSDAMARRAARDEIDVVIKEDPLRVQNRRLSFMVLVLGVIVIGALLYATDPNRFNQAVPIAIVPDNNEELPVATAESNAPVAENASNSDIVPTVAPLPEALRSRGAIAYTVRERGQTDLWALQVGSGNPIRITNDAVDERDPEWSPSGTRLAYASRRAGNWDIYVYDIFADAANPLTLDLAFEANPTWSPDEVYIAYESYFDNNLEIYARAIDGSSDILNISQHPAADYSPAWSPDPGRRIAFVSLRDGNQDIYVLNLDGMGLINLTNTPLLDEDYPSWSPDGQFIAYSAWEQGSEKVFVIAADGSSAPQLVALGRTPTWSPDGTSIAFAVDSVDGSRTDLSAVTVGSGSFPVLIQSVIAGSTNPSWTSQPLPPQLINRGGLELAAEELYIERTDTFNGTIFALNGLAEVQTETALLSDAVNDSFEALRQRMIVEAGYNYLGTLDHAFWRLERPADLGEASRSWYRTGRAFAISSSDIQGFPPPIEVVRENRGTAIYWRVFVRVDDDFQRGQLGEPLRRIPWDFLAAGSGNVDAFNQGGAFGTIQAGYYVDFTQLAADYGWERQPALDNWIANSRGINYWLFINADNLDWCQAMLQQYSEGELVNYGCTN